eukprot:10064735-Alexandrium_andersonii.AAC.1
MTDAPGADAPLPGVRPREDAGRQHLAMSDQDLRLRIERATSPHAAWADLLAGYRLIRGSA